MAQQLHSQARTTQKIRDEIRNSNLSIAELARRYNITRPTVRKWKERESVEDKSHRPHKLLTTLSPEQELIVVEIRRLLKLSTDDLFVVTREFINPKVSRAGIIRMMKRHGVNNLAALEPQTEEPKKQVKSFKEYEPGFIHVDIKYLPRMPDETEGRHYLYVAIDRASRWVFIKVFPDQTEKSSVAFLAELHKACPFHIKTILTDNGSQFTDRFTSKKKEPSGNHVFDKACTKAKIEHRLIPPRHPQTNGMVERFNARIAEVVNQTRFPSLKTLIDTLHNYERTYNHAIPQRALKHLSPIATLKEWHKKRPDLFLKNVYNHTGLDI